jgi:hypothetical protein
MRERIEKANALEQAMNHGRPIPPKVPSDLRSGMPDQCCVALWDVVGYRGAHELT